MAWKKFFSWTKGYEAETTNPDGSKETMKVHGGLFFWLPIDFGKYKIEMYAGARPTVPWGLGNGKGYGNLGIFPKLALWLRKKGWGNWGLCLRIKKG